MFQFSEWTTCSQSSDELHMFLMIQSHWKNLSFTWDKCHDVCLSEPALTWLTMRHNSGNTDTAFESGRIIYCHHKRWMYHFYCVIFSALLSLYSGLLYGLYPSADVHSDPETQHEGCIESLCFLLCCEASVASPLWVCHLNYIPAIMQSAQL